MRKNYYATTVKATQPPPQKESQKSPKFMYHFPIKNHAKRNALETSQNIILRRVPHADA